MQKAVAFPEHIINIERYSFFPLNNRIISMQFIFKDTFKETLLGSYSGNFFRVCYSYLFQGY